MTEENITTRPGAEPGETPSAPSHLPEPAQWPEGERDSREMTEYREPEGERDEPGARERERDA